MSSEPIYRPIPASDYAQMATYAQQAFGDAPETTLRWLNRPDRPTEPRGLYVDGRLVSQLELYPFEIAAGRTTLQSAGVGALLTPPHERRRGHVRRLLRELCHELYERQIPITLLGPFKESFYRQYGWIAHGERRKYRGAPQRFAPFRAQQQGQFMPAGIDQIAELDAIYRGALRGRFGVIQRTHAWWRDHVLSDFYWQHTHHAYIWRDAHGRGRSCLIYRIVREGNQRLLRVRDIVALDPEARAQLFVFLANHEDQVDMVEFFAPADAPLGVIFPDPLDCTVDTLDMLRIIDLARLLSNYGYPKECHGRLTIAVRDHWLPHNHGVFALEVQGGIGQVQRLADHHAADLACDQEVLAVMLSRFLRPRTAAAFGMLQVANRSALDLAEQLFAGLAPYTSDWF
ncbi:MAG: GNAT family N-acetyltransferase [Roseiflexaceae bacterium]